jgi:prepilin-type N-terminal cleavage/methylation domain-containing protein
VLKHIRKQDDKNLLEQGFTLIELLVVVAILGILAAVAIFAVGNLTDNAEKNACATEASTVETAAEAFNAQAGRYPTIAEMQTDTTVGTVVVGANLKTAPTHNVAGADGYQYNSSTGVVTRGANCQ